MTPAQAVAPKHSRGEFEAIARWLDVLPCTQGEGPFQPGDDAAWLRCPAPLAVSVVVQLSSASASGWGRAASSASISANGVTGGSSAVLGAAHVPTV